VAQVWGRRNLQIEAAVKILPPDKHIRVRYEDFCAEPLTTLHQITEMCDLEPLDTLPDIRTTDHHMIGNRMRRREDVIKIQQDTSWKGKERLTAHEIETINRVTADVAHRYHYALDA
jgi:hypothetical protein